MTAVDVGGQLVKQVPLVRDALGAKVPEVMMGIADRDLPSVGSWVSASQSFPPYGMINLHYGMSR
jgi:hypothetical protein